MKFDPNKKTLIIVESPTKAKTIKKYLPKNFSVIASKGHIRDLPEDKMGIDVNDNFKPTYVISADKKNIISEIKTKLDSVEQLLLATDEDREGESISWHLIQVLKPKVPYQRMVFHEITKKAIEKALQEGRNLDMKLVEAQETRRFLDRLYGFEVSPVLWKRLSNKKLSGGRVQSVGLRFLVDKEMDIMNYKRSDYYDLQATLSKNGISFSSKLETVDKKKIATSKDFNSDTGEFSGKSVILTKNIADDLILKAQANPFVLDSLVSKPNKTQPYPPFTTSTLQQSANRKLRLSARETMRVAQSLFEHGFITYMRTDSTHLSLECINAARDQVNSVYGKDYLSEKPRNYQTKSKSAQEAHEAIRPSGDSFREPKETGLSGRELQLYTLIWQRTLATQMAAAEKLSTTYKFSCANMVFSSSATSITFPGFLKVYGHDSDDEDEVESTLPKMSEGESAKCEEVEVKAHTTQPPLRFTEASLIKKLEEKEIGRPSTYSTIISTLLDRKYAVEQNNSLIPTFQGFAVFNVMENAFPTLVDYSYSSSMEMALDQIAEESAEEKGKDALGDLIEAVLDGRDDDILAEAAGAKTKYLNDFYFGSNEVLGLKEMVGAALKGKEDVKTLHIPALSGVCEDINYTVKVGPYGPYLNLDKLNEKGKNVMINIPSTYYPGTIKEEDVCNLIHEHFAPAVATPGEVVLKQGRNGTYYWQKDDKTAAVPKGKKAADSYTSEEIDFYFSLPLNLGKDESGNDIFLNNGPYGPYLSCNGKNHRVFGDPMAVDYEKAISIVNQATAAASGPLVEFKDYDGKPLVLNNGKYGAYLKWGTVNYKLPKELAADTSLITQEKAEEIIKADPDKKSAPKRRFSRKS